MASAMSRPKPKRKPSRQPKSKKPTSKRRSSAATSKGRHGGLEAYRAKREFEPRPSRAEAKCRDGVGRAS